MTIAPRSGWWRRLRHGRGFGVHSPFAYRFIREVLRERCAYYAYDRVDALAAEWPGGVSGARMLFRVAAFVNPSHAAASGVAAAIVGMACPSALVDGVPEPQTGLIVLQGGENEDAVLCCTASGATVVVPDRNIPSVAALFARLRNETGHGHCFMNGSGAAVFVGRRTLPAETFDVRF